MSQRSVYMQGLPTRARDRAALKLSRKGIAIWLVCLVTGFAEKDLARRLELLRRRWPDA